MSEELSDTQEHKQMLEVLANHWKYGKNTYNTVSVNFGLVFGQCKCSFTKLWGILPNSAINQTVCRSKMVDGMGWYYVPGSNYLNR